MKNSNITGWTTVSEFSVGGLMWVGFSKRQLNKLLCDFLVRKIANPTEPVNGQDEQHIAYAAVDSFGLPELNF